MGRCADYVLRDMDHVTHVFLYASLEKRVERIMRVEHVDADKDGNRQRIAAISI